MTNRNLRKLAVIAVTAAALAMGLGVNSAHAVLVQLDPNLASATHEQDPTLFTARTSIENWATTDGWAIQGSGTAGDVTVDSAAFFPVLATSPLNVAPGGLHLRLRLDNSCSYTTTLQLGLFRLSVTGDTLTGNPAVDAALDWTALKPFSAVDSHPSKTATIEAGGAPANSVLIGGAVANSVTDVRAVFQDPSVSQIKGFRLEALDANGDSTAAALGLPNGGPGFNSDGNFVLTEFAVDSVALGPNGVPLGNATASFSQDPPSPVFPPEQTIDGDPGVGTENGWASRGNEAAIVWETGLDVVSEIGTSKLTFTLQQNHSSAIPFKLGKFSLSVTTDDRSTFADGLANGGDVDADWTVLHPASVETLSGDSFNILPDGTIQFAGGTPLSNTDTYTVIALTSIQGITGFRLDALADPTRPGGGPGLSGEVFGDNFVLSEFSVAALPVPEPATLLLLAVGASMLLIFRRKP